MIPLTQEEINEVINIAYKSSEKYILKKISKKDLEDINISINVIEEDAGFDMNIDIELDSDLELPENLADEAVNKSFEAVDEYIEARNKNL